MDREKALDLLKKYNKDKFHIQHSLTVEGVMGYFADELGFAKQRDFWKTVGLLHDLDFEEYPEEHCIKVQEILKQNDAEPELIHAIASHGYMLTKNTTIKPEHIMEKVLYASDELTGLIWATALMHPSKSTKDLEVKSVVKKFKDKKFAAGCSRDVIKNGAQMLGWDLNYLIEQTILAMRDTEDNVKEAMKSYEK